MWRSPKRGDSLHGCQPQIAGNECNDAPFAAHKRARLDPETATKTIVQVDPKSPPVDALEHENDEAEGDEATRRPGARRNRRSTERT